MTAAIRKDVQTAPHNFSPLRWWDWRASAACRHCHLPYEAHPVRCWVPARALGDNRKAELTWDALNGEE